MSRNEAFEAGKAAIPEDVTYPSFQKNPYYHADLPESHTTDIMLGNQPSGATSARVHGSPGRGWSETKVFKGKENIGVLRVDDNKVEHIETAREHRRKGVANLTFRLANFAAGRSGASSPIGHGSDRSKEGDAWAKSTGDELPQRTPHFLATTLLRDEK